MNYVTNCAYPYCDGEHGVEKLVDAPFAAKASECSCHIAVLEMPDDSSKPQQELSQ